MTARDNSHLIVQRRGKERDLYTCQICGSNMQVEGHHILNYQYGGAASVDNIVSLCRVCHKQVHRGNIDIIKI
ncbi:MAG: HNH endonuclease [Lachnospiraceae bacterium]|nr:HNH endonuclease [Lachnospiraceae bacterium]